MKKPVMVSMLDSVESTYKGVERELDAAVQPVRVSVLRRFPIIFLLLVAFGVAATTHGLDELIARSTYFSQHPAVVLCIGIGVLFFTGTLYKKLG